MLSCPDPNKGVTLSTPTLHCSIVAVTQQSTNVLVRDIDPKKVSWVDIVARDRPSVKPGESGQMVKSVATICGIDAMTLSTKQLHLICASLKPTGYHSKPIAELL
jgi:Neuraminidase (sialidase)